MKWHRVIPGMALVILVICTNTHLVHPTWLTRTIPGTSVCPILVRGTNPNHVCFCFIFLRECGCLVLYSFSRMPMIKTLWHHVIPGMGLVSLVICTNTHLMHPTWLTSPISEFVCPTYIWGMLSILVHYSFNYYLICVWTLAFFSLPNSFIFACLVYREMKMSEASDMRGLQLQELQE